MKIKTLIGLNSIAAVLAACGGGDIELNPSNTVTDSNNTIIEGGGTNPGTTNPCATYSINEQSFQGFPEAGNCTYTDNFVSDSRPLTVDLVIPELPNGGLHIFSDSLFVGKDVTGIDAQSGVAVPQEGEGPTLTIEAGARIAFSKSEDYLRIARGSQIHAEGTKDKPIIISAVTDLRDGAADEGDRGLWGGVQINGNGLTNKCPDATNCHATAEGRPATYGGNNNSESSGVMRYVVIKHAGYEVVDGSELNGLTLNAVGSGTTIEYVQVYTTQDDGFEMFGGAVDLKYVVGVNVGDDTFDFSEGWTGNIQFALSVANSGSNNCVEADNTGEDRADDITPLTKGRLSNLTCVTSGVDANGGLFPSSKGDSEGMVYREGAIFELYNSIVTSNDPVMSSNECLEIIDSEGPQTINYAKAGYSIAKSNFIACTEATKQGVDAANADFVFSDWLNNGTNTDNVIVDESVTGALPVTILEGLATNPRAYITAAAFADGNATPIAIPAFDVTQLNDSFVADAVPALGAAGSSSFFEAVDFIGAVSAANDWTAGWTVGLAE